MKKLLFLFLAICLSSPVFAAVTDSVEVAAAGDDGHLTQLIKVAGTDSTSSYQSVATGGVHKMNYVGLNAATKKNLAHFRFKLNGVLSGATISNATMTVRILQPRTLNPNYMKVEIGSDITDNAISDTTTFKAQYASLVTGNVQWDFATVNSDSALETTPDLSGLLNLLPDADEPYVNVFVAADTTGITYKDFCFADYTDASSLAYIATLVYTYTNPSGEATDDGARGLMRGDVSGGRKW